MHACIEEREKRERDGVLVKRTRSRCRRSENGRSKGRERSK